LVDLQAAMRLVKNKIEVTCVALGREARDRGGAELGDKRQCKNGDTRKPKKRPEKGSASGLNYIAVGKGEGDYVHSDRIRGQMLAQKKSKKKRGKKKNRCGGGR